MYLNIISKFAHFSIISLKFDSGNLKTTECFQMNFSPLQDAFTPFHLKLKCY